MILQLLPVKFRQILFSGSKMWKVNDDGRTTDGRRTTPSSQVDWKEVKQKLHDILRKDAEIFLNKQVKIKNLKNNARQKNKIRNNISYFMQVRMKLCQSKQVDLLFSESLLRILTLKSAALTSIPHLPSLLSPVLVHLSRRLKCTIVITRCPSSFVRPSVVNFSLFRLLLWNRWTEFNETWQEVRSQRPLPRLCFSGRSEKQDGRPGLWLAETFSTSPLKPLNEIQQNLTGSKISTSSTKFVFSSRSVNKNVRLGRFLKKVAYCTQVHDMWPFGPLVFLSNYSWGRRFGNPPPPSPLENILHPCLLCTLY